MTGSRFVAMGEREQQDLAQRLADSSSVFDFEAALEVVRHRPTEAEDLLRMQEEFTKGQEERDRARERLRRALIEDYG
jgi:hypothetical protein